MSRYEIINGDCVEVMRRLDGDMFDLCVTSPPYDNLRQYNGYSFDFEATAKELYRVIKPCGVLVWVVGDATVNGSETGTSFRQALYFRDVCGFNLHDTMIYRKNALSFPETNRYYPNFEFMFVLSKGTPRVVNLIQDKPNTQAKKTISGNQREADGSLSQMCGARKGNAIKPFGVRWNVWDYTTGKGHSAAEDFAYRHPAIFPERLAHDHIISWSNEGDTILDPFCGSGTTGKMAVIVKRNFVGIEISPEYAALAEARIKRASGVWAEIPRLNRKPSAPTPLFELIAEST